MKGVKLSFTGSSFPIKILYDIFTQTNIYLENVERFFLRNLLSKADSYNDRLDWTRHTFIVIISTLHCQILIKERRGSF